MGVPYYNYVEFYIPRNPILIIKAPISGSRVWGLSPRLTWFLRRRSHPASACALKLGSLGASWCHLSPNKDATLEAHHGFTGLLASLTVSGFSGFGLKDPYYFLLCVLMLLLVKSLFLLRLLSSLIPRAVATLEQPRGFASQERAYDIDTNQTGGREKRKHVGQLRWCKKRRRRMSKEHYRSFPGEHAGAT